MTKIINYVIENKNEVLSRFLICIMGIFFVILCSYSTSPLYADYYGGDSAQFLTIGKAWSLGKVPYKEMFDHKGPIIYYIDMLGFALVGTKSGVCIFQILFMIITVNALFNIGKLSSASNIYSILVTGIALIFLKVNYSEGNSVEEYCLPFITTSSYYQIKFFYQHSDEHSPLAALLYGLSIGVCALTRITNGIIVCSGALVIAIILIIKKKYVNLWRNIYSFFTGCFLICIPFIIYFSIKGCLSDFIYGSFTYNAEYLKNMHSWLEQAYSQDVFEFFIVYFVYFCIGISFVFALRRKAYALCSFYALSFVLETYIYMSGASFVQYPAVCLPQLIFLLNEICYFGYKSMGDRMIKFVVIQIMVIICFDTIQNRMHSLDLYRIFHERRESYGSYENLIAEIPVSERNSFIAYGGNQFKELYLIFDLMPYYKYFVIQEWHANFSEIVRNDIYTTFMNGDVKWILTDGNTSVIDDVLIKRYESYDAIDNYVLYKLR